MAKNKYAGGIHSIVSSLKHLKHEKALISGTKALLKTNQKKGIDCPGCAWPDPSTPSVAEFCENGAKAIAAETTTKKITPAFFKEHSIKYLGQQSDYWLEQQGRLTAPMYKAQNESHYEEISWDEAFNKIANNLKTLSHPNEAVFYTSGRTSNEAAFLYQLLGRQLGTNNFPDCSNLCHESSGAALSKAIGIGKGTVTLEDFEHADLIFVIGQNPATNHPRMLGDLQKAAKRGAEIIVVNPLKEVGLQNFVHPQDVTATLLGKVTKLNSDYIQIQVGGDLAFFTGIIKSLFEQHQDSFDDAFISSQTDGFDSLSKHIEASSWQEIVNECGIPKNDIERIADKYAKAERSIACWAMGITQHKHAVLTIQQITNMILLKGNVGKKGAGLCPVRGHSNVQGDRTMGIHEKPPQAFLASLEETFGFTPPKEHGYDAVAAIEAMHENKVKVFMGLGGNFAAATPDTSFTFEALQKCALTIHVSTKLNRSHTITGKEALILPCLGRTEIDKQNGKEQHISVEDSMSMVHLSKGINQPASQQLKSEPYIVASIAEKVFGNETVNWSSFKENYDLIREKISSVVKGFEDYNKRLLNNDGFYLGNSAADHQWNTESKKAQFISQPLVINNTNGAPFKLMTVRSHDQYNTTVYGLNDRYRGIHNERNILLINKKDLSNSGYLEGDYVDIETVWHDNVKRKVYRFKLKPFDIAEGCLGAYFPETNYLVPIDAKADISHTPMSKYIPVTLSKSKG